MKQISYVITDPEGIHARPAGLLVKEANQFDSAIKIKKNDKEADAKRIFAVMGLAAKKDETIHVTAEGPDEEDAISAIEKFLSNNL
ncbi:MAG TPA: HPr family phosphocarrier protein [Oscillospiraceae bacterium]|nr:HPr family phosphocarrier protein [Oscillospiraceae bacterium]